MVRVLAFLLPLALTVYAAVDCIQTDESEVRNLPKFVWILFIVLFWVVGPIAWLLAGRPARGGSRRSGPRPGDWGRGTGMPATGASGSPTNRPPRPPAPDDDPEFLSRLQRSNSEHERMLKKWEDNLRRREEELRRQRRDRPDPGDGGNQTPPAG